MSKFVDKLPESSREEFQVFVADGCKRPMSALDIVVASSRLMASAIMMRRISWLQSSGIAPEI